MLLIGAHLDDDDDDEAVVEIASSSMEDSFLASDVDELPVTEDDAAV
jgi:hypothetical protein